MGVPSGILGDGRRWDPLNRSVHQEATYEYRREGGISTRICTVHGGGADAGDEPDGALVGSRRGK